MKFTKICSLLLIGTTYQKILTEFYIEPYGGIVFGGEKYTCVSAKNTYGIEDLSSCFNRCKLKTIKARPLVGMKLGGWIRHKNSFGLWLDCQYHHLNYCHGLCTGVNYFDLSSNDPCNCAYGSATTYLNSRGFAVTLALPFAYRWRFHEKEYAPFGCWQTYLALGPGLFLTKQCTSLTVCPHVADDDNFTVVVSDTTIINNTRNKVLRKSACLLCDGGFSYLFSRHCAIDFSLQYRFTKYTTRFNQCACLTTQKKCHLGSANIGFVINF